MKFSFLQIKEDKSLHKIECKTIETSFQLSSSISYRV